MSVFVDMQQHEILFATEGKDATTIDKFIEEMPSHNATPEQIKELSMDMSSSFILGAKKFANASITFLIISMLSNSLTKP